MKVTRTVHFRAINDDVKEHPARSRADSSVRDEGYATGIGVGGLVTSRVSRALRTPTLGPARTLRTGNYREERGLETPREYKSCPCVPLIRRVSSGT